MSLARVLVLLAVLAAPASANNKQAADYPPPSEPPVLAPWKLGQWASYRVKTPKGESLVTVRILAEDACGVWIEIAQERGDDTHSSRTCFARGQQAAFTRKADGAVIIYKNGEVVEATDHDDAERAQLLDMILYSGWAGTKGLPREDITTTGGTTILTIKQNPVEGDPARTRWSHPTVPLGGLVRSEGRGFELVLMEHGLRDSSMVFDDQQKLFSQTKMVKYIYRQRNKWMTFGFGTDLLGNLDTADWADTFAVTLGYNFTPRVALAWNTTETGLAPHPEFPQLAEAIMHTTLGLRWYPYAGSRTTRWSFLKRGVYTQLDLGYAQLTRGRLLGDTSVVGRGGVAGLRVGFSLGLSGDWKLALELHEHTAWLNSDEQERVTLGLLAIVELYL